MSLRVSRAWIALCVFLLSLASFSQRAVAQAQGTGAIAGQVRDTRGQAILGATVRVSFGPTNVSTITNEAGQYALVGLAPGTYTITADKPGFNPVSIGGVVVFANLTATRGFSLVGNTPTTAFLSGQVKDTNKKAIPDATVTLIAGTVTARVGTTNAQGVFQFPAITPGLYSLRVERSGYATSTTTGFILSPGQQKTLNIRLSRDTTVAGAIGGTVRDLNGLPVSGASVLVVGGPVTGRQDTTDSSGRYTLGNLTPGSGYAVRVQKATFLTQTIPNIAVTSNQTTPIEVTLVPASEDVGSIVGQVLDDQSRPVVGAAVRVTGGPALGFTGVTDAFGFYEIPNLVASANYALTAVANGFLTAGMGEVEVVAGQETIQNFTLAPLGAGTGDLEGAVRDAAGVSIRNALVIVTSGPQSGLFASTDNFGRFRVPGLVAGGGYRIDVTAPNFQAGHLANLVILPKTRLHVEVPLVATTTMLSGTVRDKNGAPVPHVPVLISAGPNAPVNAATNSQGEFRILGLTPATTHQITVNAPGYGPEVVSRITIRQNQLTAVHVVLQRAAGGASIKGRVADLFGNPIAGARVSIVAGPALGQPVITDAKGKYTFTGLPAGVYNVQALANGYNARTIGPWNLGSRGSVTVDFFLSKAP